VSKMAIAGPAAGGHTRPLIGPAGRAAAAPIGCTELPVGVEGFVHLTAVYKLEAVMAAQARNTHTCLGQRCN
jgi:hypothetical protein